MRAIRARMVREEPCDGAVQSPHRFLGATPKHTGPYRHRGTDHLQQKNGGTSSARGRLYDLRFVEGPFPGRDAQPGPSLEDCDKTPRQRSTPRCELQVGEPCVTSSVRGYSSAKASRNIGNLSVTTYFHADQRQLDAIGADHVLGTAHADDSRAAAWMRERTIVGSRWRTAGHLTPGSFTSRLDGILPRTRLSACDIGQSGMTFGLLRDRERRSAHTRWQSLVHHRDQGVLVDSGLPLR